MTDEPQFEQYRTRVHTVAVVCVFCDAEHGPGVEDRFVQRDGPGTPDPNGPFCTRASAHWSLGGLKDAQSPKG